LIAVFRFLISVSLASAMYCAGVTAALAHAFLDTADPAVGATIKVAPAAVTITFTEGLEPDFSSLTVEDQTGQRVDLGDAHTAPDDAKRFSVGLKPLQPGSYKVLWQATSVDTHKTSGSYSFTVAP
jgi:methionine-rich copper-binding protein CopC